MSANNDSIRETILDVIETSLEAQLRAIRRLKTGEEKKVPRLSKKGMSQIDYAYDILSKAGTPLHVNEIINQIQKTHLVQVDRESLVSALTKKVQRGDRFSKTGKNTFKAI
jgi:HB1, ASXL, restriction endonuclease HTH domain